MPRAARWSVVAAVAAVGLRRLVDVAAVRGRSMAPTLLPGDRLLVARLHRRARAGDVVLAPDPRDGRRELVKRVASADDLGLLLRGDNPAASTDARTFGTVAPASVRWHAIGRYWPLRRAGLIPRAPLVFDVEAGESACTVPQSLIAGDA